MTTFKAHMMVPPSHTWEMFSFPDSPRLISSYSSLPYFQKQAGWGTWLAITYFPPIITVSTHTRDSQLQSTSFSTIMAPFSSWPSMLSYLWRAQIVFNTLPFSCGRPTSAWQGRAPVYSLSVCTRPPSFKAFTPPSTGRTPPSPTRGQTHKRHYYEFPSSTHLELGLQRRTNSSKLESNYNLSIT